MILYWKLFKIMVLIWHASNKLKNNGESLEYASNELKNNYDLGFFFDEK